MQSVLAQVQLPLKADESLRLALTSRWHISERDFYKCDLNGDNARDYAMRVTVGEGNCLVQYDVALIADSDGYGFYLLGASPAWLGLVRADSFVLKHKGESIPDFDNFNEETGQPGEIVLQADAIEFVPKEGCCVTTFVFRNGRFHMLTTSD